MPGAKPPFQRFHELFSVAQSGCWEWTGHIGSNGYGQIKAFGRMVSAHVFAFTLYKGPVPDNLQVLHSCDNPSCVNPHHLFLGSHADNVSDKCKKGRGRFRPHLGSKNGCSKLTEEQVKEIRELKGRVIQTVMAERYGVSQALISLILLKKGWKHVS